MAKRLMDLAPWLSALGVLIMLVGLGWDGILHSQDPGLAAHEGIFTLTNPGHIVFALGLGLSLLTAVYYLVGLAQTRFLSSPRNRALSLAAAVGLVVVAIGSLALTLGTGTAYDEHAEGSAQIHALAQLQAGNNQASQTGHQAQVAPGTDPASTPTPITACQYAPIDLKTHGGTDFRPAEVIESVNGVLSATLLVTYTNPASTSIGDCPVTLRSYGGKLIGPTLRVKQGDTISIVLSNTLPPNLPFPEHQDINTPHDFNTTNLHTHGLHVSPVGNSDNVLLEIEPQSDFRFEIKVPPDHPVGTYWYHPHVHGSTAIQVSSGMEGALIIEPRDGRDPHDTPALEDVREINAAKEQIMVLQQIPYDTSGQIESYNDFGPCTWEDAQREHTINGQLYPTLRMAPGEVQRWRLIHAGVRETIAVELRGPHTGSDTTVITDVLGLPQQDLHEIALDGIALGRIDTWKQVDLDPGYRSDVLVKAGQAGTYYLVDAQDDTPKVGAGSLTCPRNPEKPSLLARIIVEGTPNEMDMPLPSDVAATVPFASLLTLDATQPITPEVNPKPAVPINTIQKVDFSVTLHNSPAAVFLAADHPFSPDRVRTLKLGGVDEWILETSADSLYYAHPFHIHVNSFQTWRTGPDGKTPQLIWKDTLLVPQGKTQYVYTQYNDYIGRFVYHCHILDHEDSGMMELLEIVP